MAQQLNCRQPWIFSVTCLYDPAVFYTNEEYKVKTGKNVNIQKEIERPELHIIARCSSSDHEQLLYA